MQARCVPRIVRRCFNIVCHNFSFISIAKIIIFKAIPHNSGVQIAHIFLVISRYSRYNVYIKTKEIVQEA